MPEGWSGEGVVGGVRVQEQQGTRGLRLIVINPQVTSPVLDRAWAAKSGLGWIGKNSNLLTQQVGSYYFIGELIVDLELDYDYPATEQ